MKRLILSILFIFSIGFIYAQRVLDANRVIVRDSITLNNETIKITGATNGQFLQRVSGRWVNGNGQYLDTCRIVNDTLQLSIYNDKKAMTKLSLKSYIQTIAAPSKFLIGNVANRNINVTLANYTLADFDLFTILPDAAISVGDTISISVNNGTQYKVFEYLSHDKNYAIEAMYYRNKWYIVGRKGEEYTIIGNNTGDGVGSVTDLSGALITNTTYSSDTLFIIEGGITHKVRITTSSTNIIVQSLSGTTPTFNVLNGLNATITLTGTTVMTFTNLIAGTSGNITIELSANRTIAFSGYTFDIAPVLEDVAGVISFIANTHNKLSWYYDGSTVSINGTKAYNRY